MSLLCDQIKRTSAKSKDGTVAGKVRRSESINTTLPTVLSLPESVLSLPETVQSYPEPVRHSDRPGHLMQLAGVWMPYSSGHHSSAARPHSSAAPEASGPHTRQTSLITDT
eukprot:550668-Amphidinium_carterae.1